MKKIYGNKQLLSVLEGMIINDRPVNSLMLYGDKGCGKKTVADYYTMQLLCSSPENGRPCGKCNACRNVAAGNHPDVTYVETSGKLGGYSVETARNIIADAYIKPNNDSGRKVYQFRDCHNMDPRTQNTLLKLIEEPPEYAHFIFTAESKYEFLPTIISRCMCLGVSPCTIDETAQALEEAGYTPEQITSATNSFHGNIGLCMQYLSDQQLRDAVDLTKKLSDSIIRKDEYGLNAVFMSAGTDRSRIKRILSMTDKLVRDAAVLAEDKDAAIIGCSRREAASLSEIITPIQAGRIHDLLEKAWGSVESNVSIPLVLTALCGEIMDIVIG
ncbi:MAG TPA: DNA polymerase III subunit delta' [Ruminococcus sp.]|nr:DNA polymerase III subunit delta' [Ruminococcus sp.]